MSDQVKTVGVVGLGVMGFDIAFLYAMKGYQTYVHDASNAAMQALSARREQTIERLKRRNRISNTEEKRARELLVPVSGLAALVRTDLVTEAVSENAAIKLALYRALASTGFAGLLTSNTSSLTRATLLANDATDPNTFLLTHFFNPVLFTRMVEVVKEGAHPGAAAAVLSFLKSLGRDSVETRDISGFVSNSILMMYAVMAVRLLQCGARVDAVDQVAKELRLLPPFVSFDSWKPSIVEDVTRVMAELRADAFLRSSPLLAILARTNPTFYLEQKPNPQIYELAGAGSAHADSDFIKRALKTSILIAAARVVELGESPAMVDFVGTEGIKLPQAPLQEIDALGVTSLLQDLDALNKRLGTGLLTAPKLLVAMADQGQTFYKDKQPNSWLATRVTA
jgi:3-hydroxybutyryl-CoA dehydrogenase